MGEMKHTALSIANDANDDRVLVPRAFLDFLRHAPVSSGVCCCGDEMEKHSDPMSCGHSPVDMWDHHLGQWLKQIAASSQASEVVRDALECAAARFDLCAQYIEGSWNASGVLRAERADYARRCAGEARAVLSKAEGRSLSSASGKEGGE